jgi:DNA repair exonuclease SbcCD ATPase subunit
MNPSTIQRVFAIAAIAAILVLFYQYRSADADRRALDARLQEAGKNADSLKTALFAADEEKGVLKSESELKKLEIARANEVLASVLQNMDAIAQREAEAKSLLQQNTPERRGRLISAADYRKIDHEINSYLEAMYTTLNSSRRRVEELQGELENALDDNAQLKSFVTNLQRMVESQDRTIQQLKSEKEQMLSQLALYEDENRTLRRAWVTIGTIEELRQRKIVRKPFLRATEINPLDSARFTAFDIRQASIPLGDKPLKDVNILTDHKKYPELFELSKDGRSLVIKDPAQFWLVSKYLIIEVQ